MVNMKIEEEDLINLLDERVGHWTDDEDVAELYHEYYENAVYGGCFDGCEFDVKVIVDNDYVNYKRVVYPSDDNYETIKKLYDKNGCGDVSCECDCCDYIEAEHNGLFLVS